MRRGTYAQTAYIIPPLFQPRWRLITTASAARRTAESFNQRELWGCLLCACGQSNVSLLLHRVRLKQLTTPWNPSSALGPCCHTVAAPLLKQCNSPRDPNTTAACTACPRSNVAIACWSECWPAQLSTLLAMEGEQRAQNRDCRNKMQKPYFKTKGEDCGA